MKIKVTKAPQYVFLFDEKAAAWTKDPERNRFFIFRQQDYANEKLKYRGYLFLNEVLDMLGIPRRDYGQLVGWIFDEENPIGDNYVSFGLDQRKGVDGTIVLDFNVDGYILDKI